MPNSIIEVNIELVKYLQVLKLSTGDNIIVFNGLGGEFVAEIKQISKKSASITLLDFYPHDNESPLHTHLILGLSKGERFDWAIRKATELGVNQITPLYTARTEVKIDQKRLSKRILHWRKVIISACEQSGRNIVPSLEQPQHISTLQQNILKQDIIVRSQIYFLDPLAHRPVNTISVNQKQPVIIIVGAEGGFNDNEIVQLQPFAQGIHLGKRILRTETAPITMLSILQFLGGGFEF